jgi:MinD-like ATPase involved in chromosome partitioning or flagellar assembly
VTRGAIVDGRPAHQGALARLRRRGQRMLVSRAEQDEAAIELRLLRDPEVTRANLVAFVSPSGGVGKTTCTFVVADLLATHLKLRAVAVDAGPGFGGLAQLMARERRSERGLADLLGDADRLLTAAELRRYVARLPSGLHVLTARSNGSHPDRPAADRYGEVVALLSCFYDVVLLDLGAGLIGPVAAFAARRADQLVLVTTQDRVPSAAALDALALLRRRERTTVAVNRARDKTADSLELCLLAEHPHRVVTVPHDQQLATMLETGTYSLGALDTPTRIAIKSLGLAVADQLV